MEIISISNKSYATDRSISRLIGVSNENAPPRSDAPIPEACNTFADAFISDGHMPYT